MASPAREKASERWMLRLPVDPTANAGCLQSRAGSAYWQERPCRAAGEGLERVTLVSMKPRADQDRKGAPRSELLQIVYSSQPFGYDESTLAGILMDARRCNARDGVTGALICRRDVFLQLLEGPEAKVRATFDRIARDDRHLDVILHLSEPVTGRMFADWAMHHDPAHSWLTIGPDDRSDGLARVRASDVRGIFAKVAARLRSDG